MNFLQLMQLFGITALTIICFIICIFCLAKIHSLSSRLSEAEDISDKIEAYYSKLKSIESIQPTNNVMPYQKGVLCKTAVVHFNAFPDVTGAVSFAAAILDNDNNGIILTSIYSHDSSNTYIREVTDGECSVHLLEEEAEALHNATEK